MSLLLLSATLAAAQSSGTYSPAFDEKVKNLGLDIRELQSGRPTLTGKPTFQGGFEATAASTFTANVSMTGNSSASNLSISGTFNLVNSSTMTVNSIAPATSTANALYQGSFASVLAVITGGTGASVYDINVTSTSRMSTGNYVVNFAKAYADTNYACFCTVQYTTDDNSSSCHLSEAKAVDQASFSTLKNVSFFDFTQVYISCFGAQ